MANLDRKELDKMINKIVEVENPDVYSKKETDFNKPISNIKFGHILNVNWDNIVKTFNIIQKFFKETVLNQDVSTDNVANQIVKRNADKSIEVGDIYSSSNIITGTMPDNSGIAFKNPVSGEIEFTKDYASFRKLTNTISQDDMNAVERLDINGSGDFGIGGGSRTITLNEKAKKYRVLAIRMSPKNSRYNTYILLPNLSSGSADENRNGGGTIKATWNGETEVTVNYSQWRDGASGHVAGVWGVI